MDIYLIQHAESIPEKEDPSRPLSNDGKATMERVGAQAALLKIKPDFIFHSEKLRAKQTAEILARHLGLSDKLRERKGLGPLDPVGTVAQWLNEQAAERLAGLAIVGHLPFLDKLASLLITGKEEFGLVSFQNGAIVKLVPRPDGARYAIQLVITKQLCESVQTHLR
ncbi:MAG TPA: phosphohistidine phosphatase SixA [Candidatus Acidoferrum sp.]|nr:phosphohistidine phosphatase SixA [Candidatus Acidoferrum sp.]